MPSRPALSKRVGKVIAIDLGTERIRISVRGLPTEVLYIDAIEVTRIDTFAEVADAAPFCPCGEPVTIWGQICRWCRKEAYQEEFLASPGPSVL